MIDVTTIHCPACADRAKRQTAAAQQLTALTPAQRRIAVLVGKGWPSARISLELSVSEHSVRVRLSEMFDRLGLENRTQLARLVWEAQL